MIGVGEEVGERSYEQDLARQDFEFLSERENL